MRYYVVMDAMASDECSYVLAEVVRDPGDDKELTLAAVLAGARARIASRSELVRTAEGRRALQKWEWGDDSVFEAESAALAGTRRTAGPFVMRAVAPGEGPRPKRIRPLPSDPVRRDVLLRSIGLREITRALVQRMKAQRAEIEELADEREGALGR